MKEKTYSILGCGWLGIPLAKHFISNGIQVNGSTTSLRKLDALKAIGVIPYLINIENTKNYKDFLDCNVLIIMITSKQLDAYKNLIQEIESATVNNVIFISSTSVYPRYNKNYTETDETQDTLLLKVENLFRHSKKFTSTIIRFAGLYGGKRHPGNWFKDRKIPQPNGFVNMIHRDDCIAIISQIISESIFGETFNACVNHHPTRKDFYSHARKRLNKPEPKFEEGEVLEYKIISSAKLIARLNYHFIHSNLLEL